MPALISIFTMSKCPTEKPLHFSFVSWKCQFYLFNHSKQSKWVLYPWYCPLHSHRHHFRLTISQHPNGLQIQNYQWNEWKKKQKNGLTFELLFWAAKINAVAWFLFAKLTFAAFSISNFTTSMCPNKRKNTAFALSPLQIDFELCVFTFVRSQHQCCEVIVVHFIDICSAID